MAARNVIHALQASGLYPRIARYWFEMGPVPKRLVPRAREVLRHERMLRPAARKVKYCLFSPISTCKGIELGGCSLNLAPGCRLAFGLLSRAGLQFATVGSMPGQAVAASISQGGAKPPWRPLLAGVAGFLCGPLAAALIVFINLRQLEQRLKAAWILGLTALACVGIGWLRPSSRTRLLIFSPNCWETS
jgi:hypothetical protein